MNHIPKSIFRMAALLAVFAVALPAARAQFGGDFSFPMPGPSSSSSSAAAAPWKSFKINPKTKLRMDFRNATPDAVIHILSQASGIPIINDPGDTKPISLDSPNPVPLDEAFAMFQAALGKNNFQLQKQDKFLVVQASSGGGGGGGRGPFVGPPAGFTGGGGGGDRNEIEVYSIKYADATALATTINNLYQATPGQATPAVPFVAPTAGAPGGGPGGGGFRGRRFGGFNFGGNNSQNNQPTVKASADTYSNSLIINAPGAEQAEIRRVIEQIDKPAAQAMSTQVFKLQYALASDVETIVQNLLNASVPQGRGNATAPRAQTNFGGGPGGFFARIAAANNPQNSGGTVSADTTTNALVVTATPDNLTEVAQIIKQLDQPATFQSSTFVYVLKNARADVVANLLNEAVGNRETNGPTGGSLTNTGPTQNSISVTSSSSSGIGGTSPTTLGGNNNGGNRNGFGNNNQFGTTSSNSMQSGETSGLDASGHVVNIRNLYGQVLFVPNVDTNSVIVVSPPEDQELVKQILGELDEIPEQVMIETLVVEVSLTKADQFGVEWSFLNNKPFGIHGATSSGSQTFGGANGSTSTLQGTTTAPQGLRYTLTAPQFQVFLNALKTDTKFNVLSTPRIFTTNNATAQINISQSLPYVTNQTVDTTGTVLYNYNFLDVGIVLTVTPRITQDGYVTMDVSQTANDFVSYTNFNAPIVNQRETETTVSVKDGETIVLGGIISDQVNDTVNKVPILGDIPLIGNLFRSTDKSDQKTELLVFLTPHVVRDPADAAKLRDATEAELGKSTQEMLPKPATPTLPSGPSPTTTVPPSPGTSTGPATDTAPSADTTTTPDTTTPADTATPAAGTTSPTEATATTPPVSAASAGASSTTPANPPASGKPGTIIPGATGAKTLPAPSQINVTVANPNH